MEKINYQDKTWYTLEGIMQHLGVTSNKTVYNMVERGEVEKTKIIGKTVFRPV